MRTQPRVTGVLNIFLKCTGTIFFPFDLNFYISISYYTSEIFTIYEITFNKYIYASILFIRETFSLLCAHGE